MSDKKSREWTSYETNILATKYSTMTAEQIQQTYLQNRTITAVRIKLTRCGLTQKTPNTNHINQHKKHNQSWSEEEDAILKKYFANTSLAIIQRDYLPERSIKGIERRGARLGIQKENAQHRATKRRIDKTRKHARWTPEELELLNTYKNDLTAEQIHEKHLPEKSPTQIRTKLRNEGFRKTNQDYWSPEEFKTLKDNAGKLNLNELQALLPNRSRCGIQRKATVEHISLATTEKPKPWTNEETQTLIKHVNHMSIQELHEQHFPNRTESAVRNRITKLRKSSLI